MAGLAGLPKTVIKRAQAILTDLTHNPNHKPDLLSLLNTDSIDDLELADTPETQANPALSALSDLDVDALSPKDALDKLYELKKILNNS